MTTTMSAPPPVETPERGSREEEVREPGGGTPVSGRLHALDRDYVLILPGGLRSAGRLSSFLFFSVFALLWLAFGVLLIVDQGVLDTIWQRLQDLPLLFQVIVWILFLPITLGLWIWESDWALWLRLALIIVTGVSWTAAMVPRRRLRPTSGNEEAGSAAIPHQCPR